MATLFSSTSFGIALTLALVACSSNDSTASSSGASGSSGSSGASSDPGGACPGDVANCPLGSLSAAQANDVCSILDAAVEDPPGTKLECKASNLFITVNSKEDCIANPPKKTCKVTVTQLLACFKAAKKDACAAFEKSGACAPLFDPASGCS
jgi:hypothetical protein